MWNGSLQINVDFVSKWLFDSTKIVLSEIMTSLGYTYENEDNNSEGVDELEIDDSLSPLEKFEKYTNSDIFIHRLHLAKVLSEISKEIEFNDFLQHAIPSITKLSTDKEPVIRQIIVEQLPDFTCYLLKNGREEQISRAIIPILDKLIVDENVQVRASSGESLIALAKYLTPECQKLYFIPIISKLSSNSKEEEHRIDAAEIMGKMVTVIDIETFQDFFIEHIKMLAKDRMFRVRKATALSIGPIAKQIGPELSTSSLLPVFLNLTKDDIWGVKKACTESIVPLAYSVSQPARIKELSKIFELFIQDNSRWVRNSAFQNIGQFISTLENGKEIPSSLFNYYCGMVDGMKNKYADNDTVLYCAYSFPGVLFTMGKEQWPSLKPVFLALAKGVQWKVRRTLSHSLHEVAKILGTELTETDLLNTFDLFLHDLDPVKVGVIRNIASFLSILSPSVRNNYIDVLVDFQNDNSNWRIRHLLSSQMGEIEKLYSDDIVGEKIIPIVIHLCSDQVTSVRHSMATEMGNFVNSLSKRSDQKLLLNFIKLITNFAYSDSCFERQTYAMCCESLVIEKVDPSLYIEHFHPHLVLLSEDKVPNIRFIISRLFIQLTHNNNNEKYGGIQNQVQMILEKLSNDNDCEVRYFSQPLSAKKTT